MLTIFSTCKPFGENDLTDSIQANGIGSWCRPSLGQDVFLFGDEPGVSDIAHRNGCTHVKNVQCNEWGTPLVIPLFRQAASVSRHEILCYVNADIILPEMDKILRTVELASQDLGQFLVVGPRWTVSVADKLDFLPGWEQRIIEHTISSGRQCQPTGLDYFIFSKRVFDIDAPQIAIGRYSWDNWLPYKAKRLGVPVLDATQSIMAIHQEHPRLGWSGAEVGRNLSLAGERRGTGYVWEADYVVMDGRIERRTDSSKDTWRRMHNWTGDEV